MQSFPTITAAFSIDTISGQKRQKLFDAVLNTTMGPRKRMIDMKQDLHANAASATIVI